ncbi:MAG: hypothetical protein ACR2NP_21430, partial [Pirellulaceae bacterium]
MFDRFIETACATNCAAIDHQHSADLETARQMLVEHPELSSQDIFTAAVCGNEDIVRQLIAVDSDSINRSGGPRDWAPLLYLCFSRFMRDDNPDRVQRLLKTASVLLESGADPNSYF